MVEDQAQVDSAARPSAVVAVRLSVLAALVGAEIPTALAASVADLMISGITANSALVQAGDLFAALPGTHGHGAEHARTAIAAGAVAVLTDPAGAELLAEGERVGPLIVLAEPRAALGRLAAAIYHEPSQRVPVWGVTGTSGKTTTSFLVRAGLEAAGQRTGLIGTVGVFLGDQERKSQLTTPEAPELQALLAVMAENGAQSVGMEVSSHALRLGRVDGVQFAVAAFTNLSQDHLDFHADMEDYFSAKAELFDGRAHREVVVCDEEWGQRLVGPATVTVARTRPAQWTAVDVRVLADGATRFTVRGPGLEFAAGCRIPGDYNITNALLAFAILNELGLDPAPLAAAVATAQVRGRMQRVDGTQPFLAVVDYSHKPAGVQAALQALRPLTRNRLIIVLGCGGDRDRGKRPLMGEVAARAADVLIVTDDNPRSEDPGVIRAAMLAGARAVPAEAAAEIHEQGDRRAAIELALALAAPGDTVLVAGKGHETGQQVGPDMLPFDDVSVVRESIVRCGFEVSGFNGSGSDGLNLGGSVSEA